MTERLNAFAVTLAQLNPTMGDIEGNAAKVRAARARAARTFAALPSISPTVGLSWASVTAKALRRSVMAASSG